MTLRLYAVICGRTFVATCGVLCNVTRHVQDSRIHRHKISRKLDGEQFEGYVAGSNAHPYSNDGHSVQDPNTVHCGRRCGGRKRRCADEDWGANTHMHVRNCILQEWNCKFPRHDVTTQPSWCGAMAGAHGPSTPKRYQSHEGAGRLTAAAHAVSSRAKSWVQTLHVWQRALQDRTAAN